MAIAESLSVLCEAGLVEDRPLQVCAICDYQVAPTLSKERIAEIESWEPLRLLIQKTESKFLKEVNETTKFLESLRSLRENLVPKFLPEQNLEEMRKTAESTALSDLLTEHGNANDRLKLFDNSVRDAIKQLNKRDPNSDCKESLASLIDVIHDLKTCAKVYALSFRKLQQFLNTLASQNEDHRARNLWLKIARNPDELILDYRWETAKLKAQEELKLCRGLLMSARQIYLNSRRDAFGDGISSIWSKLREDEHSGYSKLLIPQPTGKGYKARIEVKARLTGPTDPQEVDALNVLSESQINAIGIAAFVTRSSLLGHGCLVFDDPVQSMDDDHFKSFAGPLLSYLCDCGFQVIILTHSDDFASDISYAHKDRDQFISMEILYTSRRGIKIREGSKRVSRLLSSAVECWEDGKYQPAWVRVRMAIERLYVLIRIRYGEKPFNPRSWKRLTGEKMWRDCIQGIVLPQVPDEGSRMPGILSMTAGGAHLKKVQGFTDFKHAVDDVKRLQRKLIVGD